MNKGKFISFEGGEGSGKTTQGKILYHHLKSLSLPVIYTREIGGTSLAEQIRSTLMQEALDNKTETLLVMAARSDHIQRVIHPALDSGHWVICDRFIDSTAAYQNSIKISGGQIYSWHEEFFNLWPDLTFLLDIEVEISGQRLKARTDQINRFDQLPLESHSQIRESFLEAAKKFERIIVLRGNQEQSLITAQMLEVFNRTFAEIL